MSDTHDELEPIKVGQVVHVCVDASECQEERVTDSELLSGGRLGIGGVSRWFDRAGAYDNGIPGTWHYADHGEWRKYVD